MAIAAICYACTVFECFEKEREQNYQKETHVYIHAEKASFQKQVVQSSSSEYFAEGLIQYQLRPVRFSILHPVVPFSKREYPPGKLFLRISVLLI